MKLISVIATIMINTYLNTIFLFCKLWQQSNQFNSNTNIEGGVEEKDILFICVRP